MNTWWKSLLCSSLVLGIVGCGSDDAAIPTDDGAAETPPTSDLAALLEGAPANDSLPEDGKFDATYPATFDLMATQSPVRNQGGRGTCSIFATVALMEQLYTLEGSIVAPDFSEQFLQWSAKVELGSFPNTDGSNQVQNIRAIQRYGIVEESVYPYQTRAWSTADDPRCSGASDQPTICYTNGTPPESVLAARRWTLPAGRYVNCNPRSLKAYMTENQAGVITSVEFFYQAWGHGGSGLTVDRAGYRNGWVRSPSAADVEDSKRNPAGHAVLLVGWDDTLTVPRINADGTPTVDAQGAPVVDRGFFLFKNSWGAGSFGAANPFGAGYGWISMDYIAEYGSCYSSSIPTVRLDAEVCDDGRDNNRDGRVDCDDPQCATTPACQPTGLVFEQVADLEIPDNVPTGATATIRLDQDGIVDGVSLSYAIAHTYQGDLTVTLVAPDGRRVVVHNRTGGAADDPAATISLADFAGSPLRGDWQLIVADLAPADTGRVLRWSLSFTLGEGAPAEVCNDGLDNDANGQIDCADQACLDDASCASAESLRKDIPVNEPIPDNNPQGVTSIFEVTEDLTIADLTVELDIQHSYRGDLRVVLEHESGLTVVLHNREGAGADDLVVSLPVREASGMSTAGLWSITVSDNGNLDTGVFRAWALVFTGTQD